MSTRLPTLALPLAALCLALPALAQTGAPGAASEPAMQVPPDQAAFQSANATVDPGRRAAALDAFLRRYPASKRASRGRGLLLDLLLAQQPADVHRIHEVAKASVDSADKASKASRENAVAYALAEAPPNGIDLRSAEEWARDAVAKSTLPAFLALMKGTETEAKKRTPAQQASHDADMKAYWAEFQAANLQTLADVYFHEGKLAEASAALDQAAALNPVQGANFLTRGQIAHAQHHDSEALEALETAEVYGGMTPAGLELLAALYAAQHDGDRGGLEAEIDRRYRAIYKTQEPARHTATTSGRTLLLELYTGSACQPCAAADLAVDAVLENYPRTEVVALAMDQHIPDPDPLANAATVGRGQYDGVQFTPTIRLSGYETEQIGGRRPETKKSYTTLAAAIDKELSVPSGASLRLEASLTPAHTVAAAAHFQVTSEEALHKLLASGRNRTKAPAEGGGSPRPGVADRQSAEVPALVLNFALVQQEVRFSGENGIRFHAMVVRDLAKPTAAAFPVAPTGASSASYTFDPAAVSAALSRYLADFAGHNERFAVTHFLTKDTTLPLDQLAVAAWVEDLTSHRVVAAAYAALSNAPAERAFR